MPRVRCAMPMRRSRCAMRSRVGESRDFPHAHTENEHHVCEFRSRGVTVRSKEQTLNYTMVTHVNVYTMDVKHAARSRALYCVT